jgi:hypothetical protein
MSQTYEIRVGEELRAHWAAWFAGMELILPAGSEPAGTLLRGELRDQAALYGVLNRIRDLNLTLIEVRRVNAQEYTLNIHPAVE